jgi:hypothetical protein
MEPENLQLEISWYSYLESLLNGQEQILSFQQVSPVTSMIFVDAVKHTLAPDSFFPNMYAFNNDNDHKAPSSIITGAACKGSRTPPIPTPPLK